MRPSATTLSHGNRPRNALSATLPANRSALVGVRLLSSPRRGSNECHGNAFHNTNSSGTTPIFSNAPQTMVAVGSEKPSGQILGLLVRHGLKPERICSGGL